MGLARRDGLTGIFNGQHFVASAEQLLLYCQKSARVAALIVISFGVSTSALSRYNLRQLVIHAENARYSAKRERRNRVVMFEDAKQPIKSLPALPM